MFLVEIKSHPSRMDGDAGSWTWTRPSASWQALVNACQERTRAAGRTRQIGRRTFKGLMPQDVFEEVEGYSTQDIEVALSILAERGELPTDDD